MVEKKLNCNSSRLIFLAAASLMVMGAKKVVKEDLNSHSELDYQSYDCYRAIEYAGKNIKTAAELITLMKRGEKFSISKRYHDGIFTLLAKEFLYCREQNKPLFPDELEKKYPLPPAAVNENEVSDFNKFIEIVKKYNSPVDYACEINSFLYDENIDKRIDEIRKMPVPPANFFSILGRLVEIGRSNSFKNGYLTIGQFKNIEDYNNFMQRIFYMMVIAVENELSSKSADDNKLAKHLLSFAAIPHFLNYYDGVHKLIKLEAKKNYYYCLRKALANCNFNNKQLNNLLDVTAELSKEDYLEFIIDDNRVFIIENYSYKYDEFKKKLNCEKENYAERLFYNHVYKCFKKSRELESAIRKPFLKINFSSDEPSYYDINFQSEFWCGGYFTKMFEEVYEDRFLNRCSKIALAIEIYKRSHKNNVPKTLDDLVPKYLSKIPKDPFSGEKINYQKEQSGYSITSAVYQGKQIIYKIEK